MLWNPIYIYLHQTLYKSDLLSVGHRRWGVEGRDFQVSSFSVITFHHIAMRFHDILLTRHPIFSIKAMMATFNKTLVIYISCVHQLRPLSNMTNHMYTSITHCKNTHTFIYIQWTCTQSEWVWYKLTLLACTSNWLSLKICRNCVYLLITEWYNFYFIGPVNNTFLFMCRIF